jgi:hypothetical protein
MKAELVDQAYTNLLSMNEMLLHASAGVLGLQGVARWLGPRAVLGAAALQPAAVNQLANCCKLQSITGQSVVNIPLLGATPACPLLRADMPSSTIEAPYKALVAASSATVLAPAPLNSLNTRRPMRVVTSGKPPDSMAAAYPPYLQARGAAGGGGR